MFGFGRPREKDQPKQVMRCSFCNKSEHDVRKLVAGPTVFICDACVEICVSVIAEEGPEAQARVAAERRNQDEGRTPALDVPAWHLRCPLCERIVPTDGGVPLESRGVLCRACVVAVQATTLCAADS